MTCPNRCMTCPLYCERATRCRSKLDVAVIGGGLAGLTAALRLAQQGYSITLYEKSDALGGNVLTVSHPSKSSINKAIEGIAQPAPPDPDKGLYPHMFADWYVNFWSIVEQDLGIKREELFEQRFAVKILQPPPDPDKADPGKYVTVEYPSTLASVLKNLGSDALPWHDMFLFAFSIVDLVSRPLSYSNRLRRLTVNGFLYSQPYATDNCADLHEKILMEIWSIHANQTSAWSYKTFFAGAFGYPPGRPFAWLLKGSIRQNIIQPLEAKLSSLSCTTACKTEVTSISIVDGRPTLESKSGSAETATKAFDHVVVAVPPNELAISVATGSSINAACVDKVTEILGAETPAAGANTGSLYYVQWLITGSSQGTCGLCRV